MKVLLVAPHPWYQERGTPIAVDLLIQVLTTSGHQVTLLTFSEGEDKHYTGLEIVRVSAPWNISGIMPGFSIKKVLMDFFLFWKMWGLLRGTQYDVIHAVEESAFFGALFSRGSNIKFVYDMDSSISSQLIDRFSWLKPVSGILRGLESIPIRKADAVVPVCDALEDLAREYRQDAIFTIKDVSLVAESPSEELSENIRTLHSIEGPMFMYIGNLESYQGIDLMLDSFALALQQCPNASLVIIGGTEEKIEYYRDLSRKLAVDSRCYFLGQKPVAQIDAYMKQADVMVSPRTQGENTPMKLYSYLDSGRAVLATNLPTHTQVATQEIAYLANPTVEDFAKGFVALTEDPGKRQQLADAAKSFIKLNHSFPVFESKVRELYDYLADKNNQ